MKIDRIVFTSSEYYAPFWNIQSRIWKTRFGVEPTLFLFGDKKAVDLSEKYGEVVQVTPNPDLPPILQITLSKFFYPAMGDPDTTYILGDIDLIPLQTKYFTDHLDPLENERYAHLAFPQLCPSTGRKFSDCGSEFTGGWNMPGNYHVAKGSWFRKLFFPHGSLEKAFEDIKTLRPNVKSTLVRGHNNVFRDTYWGAEEVYSTNIIWNAGRFPAGWPQFYITDYLTENGGEYQKKLTYIDRDSWRYKDDTGGYDGVQYTHDQESLATGKYVDIHCYQHYKQQEPALMKILESAGMV